MWPTGMHAGLLVCVSLWEVCGMMRSVVCRMYPWCMATLARQGRWLHLHTRIASACSQTVLLLALPDGSVQALSQPALQAEQHSTGHIVVALMIMVDSLVRSHVGDRVARLAASGLPGVHLGCSSVLPSDNVVPARCLHNVNL